MVDAEKKPILVQFGLDAILKDDPITLEANRLQSLMEYLPQGENLNGHAFELYHKVAGALRRVNQTGSAPKEFTASGVLSYFGA